MPLMLAPPLFPLKVNVDVAASATCPFKPSQPPLSQSTAKSNTTRLALIKSNHDFLAQETLMTLLQLNSNQISTNPWGSGPQLSRERPPLCHSAMT